MQPEHDFHVVENVIEIDFEVPLPADGADEVLTDLLTRHALDIVKDRKERGQPLDAIPQLRITAKRRGELVEVATIDLSEPEVVEMELPDVIPALQVAGYDLLARFGERSGKTAMPLKERVADELPPLSEQIRLTAGLEAELRTQGIDPETMTVAELGIGLLRYSGYNLSERGDGTFVAAGNGGTTLVSFVNHEAGDYPELTESMVTSFLVAYGSARTERGLLISDKYGPYLIYQKERANPNTVFVARERLQDFVDAVALA
ncbi:MAG: hypothetical protein QNJ88_16850 [Acidimicrobiia bacterium]|nr:hypothetical protein [Acidimicrobiia bacterium]